MRKALLTTIFAATLLTAFPCVCAESQLRPWTCLARDLLSYQVRTSRRVLEELARIPSRSLKSSKRPA